MAKGDFTPKCLMQRTLTDVVTYTSVTPAANKRMYVTAIALLNTGTFERVVSVYYKDYNSYNEIMRINVAANGGCELLTDLPWVLAFPDLMAFKQDAGSDVNIVVLGKEEELV